MGGSRVMPVVDTMAKSASGWTQSVEGGEGGAFEWAVGPVNQSSLASPDGPLYQTEAFIYLLCVSVGFVRPPDLAVFRPT